MARTNTNSGGGGGGVASVTASLPLASSGGANPNITINEPASNRIWYSDTGGTLSSDAFFTRHIPDDRFTFASTVNLSNGIFYNGTGAPNPLGVHSGLGMDFRAGTAETTLGWVGTGNNTNITIIDTSSHVDVTTSQWFEVVSPAGNGLITANTSVFQVNIGDVNGFVNATKFILSDSTQQVHTIGKFPSTVSGKGFLNNFAGQDFAIGDLDGAGNSNLIWIEDDNNIISARTPGYFHVTNPSNQEWFKVDVANTLVSIGDVNSVGTDTLLTIDDVSRGITGSSVTGGVGGSFFSSATGSGVLYNSGVASWGFQPDATGGGRSSIIANNITWTWPNADSTGTQALFSDGAGNLSWGSAGANLWSIVNNTLYDNRSGNGSISGIENFLVGSNSGLALTTGNHNTFMGLDSGNDAVGGYDNIGIGRYSLSTLTSGFRNVGLGVSAGGGSGAVTGSYNTSFNYQAGYSLTTGSYNFFAGENAGLLTSTGTDNVFIGGEAGRNNTSSHNIFLGKQAGYENVSNSNSVFIGREAGQKMQADESIAIGYQALLGSATPANNTGQRNIALGRSTLASITSGQNNIAIGYGAGTSIVNGAENIMIGQSTGLNIIATSGNTFIGNSNSTTRTSGNNNTIIGAQAGGGIGTGATNAGLGYNSFPSLTSGGENVAIGSGAGATLTTGSQNTLVGPSTAVATAGTSGAIALGYQATAAANEFALPNSITNFKFQGDSYTLPTAFPAANDQALVSSTAGVQTWGPVISSGFYTPTLTNVTNVAASTVYDAQWMRIGNVVTVGGRVEVDPTAGSTLTELGISLPIASDIQGLEGVVGTAFSSTVQQGAAIQGDAANNRAQMTFDAATTANSNMYYTYIYTII